MISVVNDTFDSIADTDTDTVVYLTTMLPVTFVDALEVHYLPLPGTATIATVKKPSYGLVYHDFLEISDAIYDFELIIG